jgi:hypothetical protein
MMQGHIERIVKMIVFFSRHYFKILDSVVQTIPVFMVNNLRTQKWSFKVLLNNMTMLPNIMVICANRIISRFYSSTSAQSASIRLVPTRKRAILCSSFYLNRPNRKIISALSAFQPNHMASLWTWDTFLRFVKTFKGTILRDSYSSIRFKIFSTLEANPFHAYIIP